MDLIERHNHLALRFHKALLLSRRTRACALIVVVAATVAALGCAWLRPPASRRSTRRVKILQTSDWLDDLARV